MLLVEQLIFGSIYAQDENLIDDIPQEERDVQEKDKDEEEFDLSELDVLDEDDKKILERDDFNAAANQPDRVEVSEDEEDDEIDSLQEEISEVIDLDQKTKKNIVDVEESMSVW